MDPFPAPQRDLAGNVEEYIVGWARELPRGAPFDIIIHLPATEITSELPQQLSAAVSTFFRNREQAAARDLKELFRIGRWSLLIGLGILAVCILLGLFLQGRFGEGFMGQFAVHSLVIFAWVANWRPIEIFLYEWWPLVRRRNLYRRLATAPVVVRVAAA